MDTSNVAIKVLEKDDVVKLQQKQEQRQKQNDFVKAKEVFHNMQREKGARK